MFAAESHTSRHHIAIAAMACLCVLLGGPSYAAGAESLFIAGATYCEPGVSGPGWAWTDAGHLELDGYAGDAIGADGDLVVTLVGQNSVVESQAPDADISQCGMEVWGDLTLSGTGSLAASGSQCAIHVSRALVVDGCTVDARADGANVTGEAVAGVIAGDMAVRGGGRFRGKCETVANTFLLSRRETEILFFLAKGHNAAYIQEKLYISEGTAKTHIRHIYRKCDVHNQQDLMRMVEDAQPTE